MRDGVLLVEDDEDAADSIEGMLHDIGYRTVLRAETVEEALRQIQTAVPRIAVLDASLHGKPAHAVASQLAESAVPFVVSTGFDPKTLPGAFRHGVPLRKPYDRKELYTALMLAIARQRAGQDTPTR